MHPKDVDIMANVFYPDLGLHCLISASSHLKTSVTAVAILTSANSSKLHCFENFMIVYAKESFFIFFP